VVDVDQQVVHLADLLTVGRDDRPPTDVGIALATSKSFSALSGAMRVPSSVW
jgi:hypothetical protein